MKPSGDSHECEVACGVRTPTLLTSYSSYMTNPDVILAPTALHPPSVQRRRTAY
jgi:hypothetical protein